MRNFLQAFARGLVRAFALAAYAVYLGAEWVYHQTAAGSEQVAEADEVQAENAEAIRDREYKMWAAEQCKLANEYRDRQSPTDQQKLDNALRARMGGEEVHPDKVSEFINPHRDADVDDNHPTLH